MRIDAARKQRFERRVDVRPPETTLHQRVEAEPRQVALVEHDRMPQFDGTAVVRLVTDQIEQPLRTRAVAQIPVDEGLTVESGHAFHYCASASESIHLCDIWFQPAHRLLAARPTEDRGRLLSKFEVVPFDDNIETLYGAIPEGSVDLGGVRLPPGDAWVQSAGRGEIVLRGGVRPTLSCEPTSGPYVGIRRRVGRTDRREEGSGSCQGRRRTLEAGHRSNPAKVAATSMEPDAGARQMAEWDVGWFQPEWGSVSAGISGWHRQNTERPSTRPNTTAGRSSRVTRLHRHRAAFDADSDRSSAVMLKVRASAPMKARRCLRTFVRASATERASRPTPSWSAMV